MKSGDKETADRRRLQMADIARMAGVSVSTVSRCLNGSPLVNAETRRRVEELARSLNYTINLGAKSFRLQENRTVSVVVPYDRDSRQHISDPFFLTIVGAIADALTAHGFDMLLSRVDADHLDQAIRAVEMGKASGLLLIGQWRHHDQLNALASRHLPVVVWGAELPQQLYCTVGGDNHHGGQLATGHLIEVGRRRIAFVGDAKLPEVLHRRNGYWQALREAGVQPDPALELAAPFEPGVARAAIEAFLARHRDVDAVVACSDLLALEVVRALRGLGRSVPGDVSVTGYDDMALASYGTPALTTVHQPVTEAAATLVSTLLRMLAGERVAPRTLPVHLVVRDSTIPA
ncbi:LacI family DNA-binding transcriptional regulator [Roseateles sp. SL47]|jgi:DNA-binding LacI/PurR family transcriptional regulator|uniref:LacI family DNA-binding transcriptional regulator n=1 Tax=Roseateles sp. SL47 TaxID=2995138 RepID=UPI00226F7C5F|nr:LacI family DNA-binding transcriptional regulator [Roseateles sp. SL47]WAC71575.1 LacI family DNA-binding transcriptional regulator [Roseateles sp. SL47]